MIQIGISPLPTPFPEGPSADPDEITGRQAGKRREPAGLSTAAADDGILFVSPPPLPFPRVFPGL
jgi:hypothetical protein